MTRKIFYIVILLFISPGFTMAQVSFNLPANTPAANINYAEYFIDTDPGFGSGTPIPVSASKDITANNYSVDLSSVVPGVHHIFFRTKDKNGAWSLTNEKTFFKLFSSVIIPSDPTAAKIKRIEYFIDTDPGYGNGISIPASSSTDVTVNNFSIDISAVAAGVHRIYFRVQDAKGSWSLTNVKTFFIANVAAQIPANPIPASITRMEYFIDSDPGFGKGTPITIASSTDVTDSDVAIDLTGLTDGVHHIFVRTLDANGSWSETNAQLFNILLASVTIPPNPAPGNITKLEYFFDTDPGFGKGTIVTIPATTDLSNYKLAVDLTGLKNDTTHTLYIRTFDDWSLTNTKTFTIGTILPLTWISFNAKAVNNNVQLEWVTAKEINTDHFDVERSSDGVHFSKIGSVNSKIQSAQGDYTFTDANPVNGTSYYRLKQVDKDGNYFYSITISVRMNTRLSVKIIGNPVSQTLHLEINGANGESLPAWITDASGKKYKTFTATDGSKQIDMGDLASGIYFLMYQSGGNIYSIPFTKQ